MIVSFLDLTCDGYLRADGHPPGYHDYEAHLYVNTQCLNDIGSPDVQDRFETDSPKKDIFDMSMYVLLTKHIYRYKPVLVLLKNNVICKK